MYLKTSGINFQKYGTTYPEHSSRNNQRDKKTYTIKNKTVDALYLADVDTYYRVNDGIVLVLVTKDLKHDVEAFVTHQVVCIKAGTYYNFISITKSSKIEISGHSFKNEEPHKLTKPYIHKEIKPTFMVSEIYSYYYVVRSTDYFFPGEKHDYWEITIINNGCLHTTIDDEEFTLKENELILYAPGQFHTQSTDKESSCSYLTIMFDMDIKDPSLLINRKFSISRNIRQNIEEFVKSSTRKEEYFDDILVCNLERMIIALFRSNFEFDKTLASTPMQQKFDNELMDGILNYINENIYTQLTIEELCLKFSMSRSSLQLLFKNNLGIAPKAYISDLKLKHSKQLIKESKYTISEISLICGYTSIQYYSRRFKKEFGITPTDYAKSFMD